MASVPLTEVLKNMKPGLPAALVTDLLRKSDLLNVLPFAGVDNLKVKGARYQALPSTGKRKLNAGYTPVYGTKEEIEETLFIYGGEVKIDRIYTKIAALFKSELEVQTEMLAESVARAFNYDFINGDHAVDADGLEGLKKRIGNMPARYKIDLESGGTTLSVLASAANTASFLDAMHKAVKYIGGKADAIFCNESGYLGIGAALRRSGLLQTTTDAYGRTWDTLDMGSSKPRLIDVGIKADLSTEIITNTEATATDGTSLYVVRMGDEDGLNGLNLNGTSWDVYDPLGGGESESTPAYLRRIDWAVGLKNFSNNFSVCRVTGVKFV